MHPIEDIGLRFLGLDWLQGSFGFSFGPYFLFLPFRLFLRDQCILRRITRTPVVVVPPSIVNLPLRLLGRTSLLTSTQFANISPEYLQSLFTAIFAR